MVGIPAQCLEWQRQALGLVWGRRQHQAPLLDLLDQEEVELVQCQEWSRQGLREAREECLGLTHLAMGIPVSLGKEGKGSKGSKVSAVLKGKINCLPLQTLAKKFVHLKA